MTVSTQIHALTDVGNGERFARDHAKVARYVGAWRRWLVWNGKRWKLDDEWAVMRLAKRTAKEIISDARGIENAELQEDIAKHWIASQARSRLDSMVYLAASEKPFPINHEHLDADSELLNCGNGVVDLTTGELLPHSSGRLMSLSTNVEYPDDAGAESPLWLDFLDRIFAGDVDLIRFLQRLMGVALFGEQREHLLPVFHGNGANGKSVFVSAVQHALGEYAVAAPPGLLIASNNERHPTELAVLFRRRLVVVSETRDAQRLDEGLVKAITGGDRIAARRMREDFWEFNPSHLAIVVTNHRPIVRGTDNGIWRRLRLVPFEVTIPPEEQDRTLPEKLRREAPAILKWMVQGCLDWQRHRLSEPPAVMVATQEYRTESDTLARWIADECVELAVATMLAGDGFACYQAWCEREGEAAMSLKKFGERMRSKYANRRSKKGRIYEGIGLRGDGSDP
ncbi:MAG: phage/plasmid primase, P4 family [Planctomycetota bacterium]